MPLRETAFQGYTFLALAYAGLAAGLLCDLASPLLGSPRLLLRLSGDLLACAALTVLCFLALAGTRETGLRLYMPLGMLTGVLLYRLGLRRLLAFCAKMIRKKRKSPPRSE
ncbi:MAG: hypothetical protein IJS53_04945 [Clostridia bacterium]|nr:hypothetical protein [Clostridia bacterium]